MQEARFDCRDSKIKGARKAFKKALIPERHVKEDKIMSTEFNQIAGEYLKTVITTHVVAVEMEQGKLLTDQMLDTKVARISRLTNWNHREPLKMKYLNGMDEVRDAVRLQQNFSEAFSEVLRRNSADEPRKSY